MEDFTGINQQPCFHKVPKKTVVGVLFSVLRRSKYNLICITTSYSITSRVTFRYHLVGASSGKSQSLSSIQIPQKPNHTADLLQGPVIPANLDPEI